jgi:drug/metabolite transporter (DMT)-like permease
VGDGLLLCLGSAEGLVITTADPLVSIGVAYAWLGETITATPLALAGELISLIVMAAGIYALARRAPHVMSSQPQPSVASLAITPDGNQSPG